LFSASLVVTAEEWASREYSVGDWERVRDRSAPIKIALNTVIRVIPHLPPSTAAQAAASRNNGL